MVVRKNAPVICVKCAATYAITLLVKMEEHVRYEQLGRATFKQNISIRVCVGDITIVYMYRTINIPFTKSFVCTNITLWVRRVGKWYG